MELLQKIRKEKPLIHHITNAVTTSECAQIVRSVGALPVMAYAREEVEDMVKLSSALVLNIGTLSKEQIETMLIAGRVANKKGIPIILDPVGVGATKMRTESALRLIKELRVAVICGNAAEIATLAGAKAEVRGVESISVSENIEEVAKKTCKRN